MDIRETPMHLKFGEHQPQLLTAQNHARAIQPFHLKLLVQPPDAVWMKNLRVAYHLSLIHI